MNFLEEMYLREYRRREQLAGLEDRWQIIEWERAQEKRPFRHKVQNWLQFLSQLRKIRVQISFEIGEPCPEGMTR